MAKSWGDSKGTKNRPKWTDEVREHKFPHRQWEPIRAIGGVTVIFNHWVKAYNTESKLIQFPIMCEGFDQDSETQDSSKCWACKADVYGSKRYFGNWIIRDEQEKKPAKARPIKKDAKFMTVKDEGWNPVRVIGLPPSLVDKLLGLKERNRHKVKDKNTGEKVTKTFYHSHPRYGFDVDLKYNPDAKGPGNQWDIQQGAPTALTDEEKAYLLYDMEIVHLSKYRRTAEDMKKDLIRCGFLDAEGKPLNPEKGIGRIKEGKRQDDDDDSKGTPQTSSTVTYDDDEDYSPPPPQEEDDDQQEGGTRVNI